MSTAFDFDTLILGAGLTGLSAAQHLHSQGHDFRLLDLGEQPGGVLQSRAVQGYTLDYGANSMALTPELHALTQALGLEEQLLTPSEASQSRLIYRDGTLHAVKPSPRLLFSSRLLSTAGKLRLLGEPLRIRRSAQVEEETVAAFFTRRLGREAYQYLLEPVLTGIYAGDGERLSVDAVMPRMVQWERTHGSLLRGLMAQRKQSQGQARPGRVIASWRGGMHTLALALAQLLGDQLWLHTEVVQLSRLATGYAVDVVRKGHPMTLKARQVIWALPATAAQGLAPLDSALAQRVQAIPYAPMLMLYLGYERAAIGRPLDSFGFLVPGKADLPLLGSIWNSAIFADKAPEGEALFTLFVGGARHQGADEAELLRLSEAAQQAFEQVMDIQQPPRLRTHYHWPQAIPQYERGHPALQAQAEALEAAHPGLHLAGNWLRGVSVGDCVKAGQAAAEKVLAHAGPGYDAA
jgi:protoporphyrinogen/coproporphyrinogen III oxidase